MDQTRRENWAEYLALFASVIPAMIATNLFPAWNVLPLVAWLMIAIVGSGIAGAVATPLWGRGLTSGLLVGAGIFGGIWLYVTLRTSLAGHVAIRRPEIVIGAILGGAPGGILYYTWASPGIGRPEPRDDWSSFKDDRGAYPDL